MSRKPAVAIVGAGSLASSLALTLREAGYRITEILSRESASSRQHARKLAAKVGAQVVVGSKGNITAQLAWFCVPDRQIRAAASAFARREQGNVRFAFHSSGALPSSELESLRKKGAAVASVHPLMTFVPGSRPPLAGVPFALEGDANAVGLARGIVRDLGGESFLLPMSRKPAYHAWATMTSPLLVAYLVALEAAAKEAGLTRDDARRMSLPIIRQTLDNYARLGPRYAFSGPFIRGDTETVARHLTLLEKNPHARAVYRELARAALDRLPVRNRKQMQRLLEG